MPKLNLGCGRDIKEGYINLDFYKNEGVNVICDLNDGHLPFENNYFDEIQANHVFEHLPKWENILIECYRVLKPNGIITIRVPYKLFALNSAYHVRFFNKNTMGAFCMRKSDVKEQSGLDTFLDFKMIYRRVNKTMPFIWHLYHYCGIDYRNNHTKVKRYGIFPDEIIWILEKPKKLVSVDDCYCSDYMNL